MRHDRDDGGGGGGGGDVASPFHEESEIQMEIPALLLESHYLCEIEIRTKVMEIVRMFEKEREKGRGEGVKDKTE